ncbi:MAG: hypothetical protein JWN08_2943 [Frankiales bacterium]|nr:hypothetical protein [Frankiales bacterium]
MTVPHAARRRPSGRYDEPSLVGQQVLAVLLGVMFIGLLVAVFFALYSRFVGQEDVRGRVISFDVQSDSLVVIDVEASKAAGGKAYCVIRARGEDGAEVGRDVAVLDAVGTDERVTRGDFRLSTTSRAVTGELAQCTDQPLTRADVS